MTKKTSLICFLFSWLELKIMLPISELQSPVVFERKYQEQPQQSAYYYLPI